MANQLRRKKSGGVSDGIWLISPCFMWCLVSEKIEGKMG